MKDTPFRRQLKTRTGLTYCFGKSTIPGTITIEARHEDFACPVSTIWYCQVANGTLEIKSMYTPSTCRACGVAGWLFERLLKHYPTILFIVTGSDTRYSGKWLALRGFVRNEARDLVLDVKGLRKKLGKQ